MMTPDTRSATDAILCGSVRLPSPPELAALIRQLQRQQQFSTACQLLAFAIAHQNDTVQDNLPVVALARRDVAACQEAGAPWDGNSGGEADFLLWLIQQQALCTYKDPNLTPAERTARALALLNRIGLSDPNLSHAETLALGAAVYKRAWEQNGLTDDLQRSLALYEAGWQRNNADPDSCHCADQAAFIYDLLAFRSGTGTRHGQVLATGPADSGAWQDERALHYRACAHNLRRIALAEMLRRQQLWPRYCQADLYSLLTLANLQLGFGLQDTQWLPAATASFQAAASLMCQSGSEQQPVRSGQNGGDQAIQEVFRQAMALVRLHHYLPPESGNPGVENPQPDWQLVEPVFQALLGKDSTAARTSHRGKVGLGLSGGGFRAAFYHIGVMTRLGVCAADRSRASQVGAPRPCSDGMRHRARSWSWVGAEMARRVRN